MKDESKFFQKSLGQAKQQNEILKQAIVRLTQELEEKKPQAQSEMS